MASGIVALRVECCKQEYEMPMNIYEVELKRTSYVTYMVQALDENHAEDEAWRLLERDGKSDTGYADWEVESVGRAEI